MKYIKIILISLGLLVLIILLDTVQARVFKNSPIISFRSELSDADSWVDKGILIDTYYCIKEKDIVTVSWHFKTSKFTCPVDNEKINYNDYEKTSILKSSVVDVDVLVMFNNNLYGKSYAIIDYLGFNDSIGVIDKLIPEEYIPKLNGETNSEELLNALVFDGGGYGIVLLYNNEYVLFEKIDK